jgi:hypothetical protein
MIAAWYEVKKYLTSKEALEHYYGLSSFNKACSELAQKYKEHHDLFMKICDGLVTLTVGLYSRYIRSEVKHYYEKQKK